MKKRILGLLLTLVLALSLVPCTAFAAEQSASGKCGENLTWTLDDEGTLTISGTGAMDVMSEWNGRRDDIKSVVIGDGVTSIGDGAFRDCANLASVTISDSVTSIGNGAFAICDNLVSVAIGNSVTSIGDGAFKHCINLASVTIPDSVTSIGTDVFQGTPWAKSHGDFLVVNGMLLQYQGKGGDVTIPDSVERIVDYVCYCNYSITSLTIPDSVTSIGDYAFYNCSNLETVNYTGDQSEWEKISIGDGNDVLNKMQFAVVGSGTCGDNLTWTLDTNGTLTISGTGAMNDMPELLEDRPWPRNFPEIKQIIIEDGVTSIGKHAFQAFFNLASVTIPDSVTSIGDWAFSDCETLTNVTIPDSVTSIGDAAFWGCSDIRTVSIGNGVTSIGNMAFNKCFALKSIIFAGDNPPAIDSYAFTDVTATAYYPANNKTWKDAIDNGYGDGYGGKLTWEASHAMHARGVFPGYDATCTQEGRTDGVLCLTCHELIVKGEVIPAKPHKYVWMDNAAEATCSKTGVKEGVECSVCGEVLIAAKELPIDPNNHENIVTDKGEDATCSKTGLTEGSHCEDCGKVLVAQKVIPATGDHTTKATTTKATLKANGKIVYKCPTCGKTMQSTKTVYMPKTFSLSYTKTTYNGKVKAPTVTVKDSKGNVLKKGTDYKVTYAPGRKAVGTYKVTIEGIGKYSFKKTLTFKINPAATKIISATNVATKSIKVKWNKAAGADGYQVKYVKGATTKTVTVKGASSLTKTLSKLTKGATYKVYVRSYKTVNSTNYYSAWCAYKSVKVAK